MIAKIAAFFTDESGATAIEYALIAVLIAIAIMGGLTALSAAMNSKYQYISTSVAAT